VRSSVAYDSRASFDIIFSSAFPASLVSVFKYHLHTIKHLRHLLPASHIGTQWIAFMAYAAGLVSTWKPKKTNLMTGRRNFGRDI
jgi:hypothetical protein